jgi:hypothetical protein
VASSVASAHSSHKVLSMANENIWTPDTSSPEAFATTMYAKGIEMGMPDTQARLMAAQASLESNHGRSGLASNHNNLFGVKAGSSWDGPTANMNTREQAANGSEYRTNAAWRKYSTPEDSIRDWQKVVGSKWPEAMNATDLQGAVAGLRTGQQGGYATDKNYLGLVNARSGLINPEGYQVAGPPLPANAPGDGILAQAMAHRQPAGILGSVVNPTAQQETEPKYGMAYAGGALPLPPGAIPNPPVTQAGLGAGGAGRGSLPSMALNPSMIGQNPSMPGQAPVGVPGGPNLAPQGQPGSLIPSDEETPPALVLNRLSPMETRVNPSRASGDAPANPMNLPGASGGGIPAPQGTNPAAPPFAGGFFDRLQNSGIGDSLTRAGAALMARDNPQGAAALLGILKEGKSKLVPGEIKQMQDGSFAREMTDRETGQVSMVPVSNTQVPQELLDVSKARQLAISKAQQAESEHSEDRTLDRAYKEARLKKLNGEDANGTPDLTTPEGQMREKEDQLFAERYTGPFSGRMTKDGVNRAVGYLARHGTSPEEVRQSQTKATADLAGLREMAKVKDLAAISSGEAVSALVQTTDNVKSYYETVQDTGIPKFNQLKFEAARNGLLGEEAGKKSAAVETSFNNLYSQIAQAANKTGNATLVELRRQMETYGPSMPKAMWEAAAEVLGTNVKGTQESRQTVYERQNSIDSGRKPASAPAKKDDEKGSARRNFLINGQ